MRLLLKESAETVIVEKPSVFKSACFADKRSAHSVGESSQPATEHSKTYLANMQFNLSRFSVASALLVALALLQAVSATPIVSALLS